MDNEASKAPPEILDPLACQDHKDPKERGVNLAVLDLLENLEQLEEQDGPANLGCLEIPVLMEPREKLEKEDYRVSQGLKDLTVHLVEMESLEYKDQPDNAERMDKPVLMAKQDQRVTPVMTADLADPVPQEHRVKRVPMACRESKVPED